MSAPDFILSPQEKRVFEPLQNYLAAERIAGKKELVINKPKRVGYEAFDGTWSFEDAPDLDTATLMNITRLLADLNRQNYSVSNPNISIRMPGGHRCQVVGGDQIESKFSMTIRLKQEREFSLDNYDIPTDQKGAIIQAVKDKKTLILSGGTGSGKTSFMNALIQHIPLEERLVTLEDVRELRVPHENWCGLVFSNTRGEDSPKEVITALLNATLRMRPDRILMGEVRKENAFTFASAINTGHQGSMATVHASDASTAVDAIINRAMMNGDVAESALTIMRKQLETDVYGVVQLHRKDGGVAGEFVVLN